MKEVDFGNLHNENPWVQEPPTKGPGNLGPQEVYPDRIWNGMSPEIGFCQFIVELLHELQWQYEEKTMLIVESGVGQGFVTRRVLGNMREEDFYVGCEVNQYFIDLIPKDIQDRNNVAFVIDNAATLLTGADLVILDSDMDVRPQELEAWIGHGKPGSHLVIHDTPEMQSPSGVLVSRIARSGIPGHYTTNYRGGWHGIHP
jgi:hypothetical protein